MNIIRIKQQNEMEYAINLDAIAYVAWDRRPENEGSLTIHFTGDKGNTLLLHNLTLGEIQRIIGR